MKAALIGYGYWGRIIEKYIAGSDFFELVGIYDRDVPLPVDGDFAAAFICTPVDTHYECCSALLAAGKHVFCEKPTTNTVGELRDLETLARAKRLVLYTDYTYTVSRCVNKLKELLPSLGEPLGINARISQFGHFYDGQSAASVVGVHMLSAVLHLLGRMPDKVQAREFAGGLYGFAGLEFGPVLVHLEHGLLQPRKERSITAFGTGGVVQFDMLQNPTLRQYRYAIGSNDSLELIDEWDFDESNNLELAVGQFAGFIQTANIDSNLALATQVLEVLPKLQSGD